MPLITFPGTFPSAIPQDADPQYEGATFWFGTDGTGGSRYSWWVPTADIGSFCRYIGGQATTVGTVWGSVTRIVPHESPLVAGEYARRVEGKLGGKSFGADMYSGAWITVDYESPTYQVTGGGSATPYMIVRRAQSAEAITVPGRYVSLPSGTKLNQDAVIAVPGMQYQVTCFQVPAVNDAAIQAALAAPVNSTTLYLNELTIAAGHAFFEGLQDETAYLVGGTLTRTVTYSFRFRQRLTYNQIVSPVDGTLVTPVMPGGGAPYSTSDLNLIFV